MDAYTNNAFHFVVNILAVLSASWLNYFHNKIAPSVFIPKILVSNNSITVLLFLIYLTIFHFICLKSVTVSHPAAKITPRIMISIIFK